MNEAAKRTPINLKEAFATLIPQSIPTVTVQQRQLPNVILGSNMSDTTNQDETDLDEIFVSQFPFDQDDYFDQIDWASSNDRMFPTSDH
jgi:hypothetical protein